MDGLSCKKIKVLRLKGGDPSFLVEESRNKNSKKWKYKILSGITSSQPAIKN